VKKKRADGEKKANKDKRCVKKKSGLISMQTFGRGVRKEGTNKGQALGLRNLLGRGGKKRIGEGVIQKSRAVGAGAGG